MIILTGHSGFIGSHFLSAIEEMREPVICLGMDHCWKFMSAFTDWKKTTQIIHQGAMSSTTNTNLKEIFNFNIEYSQWLFENAILFNIPVKYASSASVYGNEQGIINPLNYYALSKVTTDYWVQDNIDKLVL